MLQKINQWLDAFSFGDLISFLMFLAAIVGGFFALRQWRKRNVYKRGEIVQQLIKIVRDDKDIATIMDIIDWNEGCYYNGKFHLIRPVKRSCLQNLEDDEFFKMVDRSLSHFSYICYLYHQKTLGRKDMKVFNYEIHRLTGNEHIMNYLFSLYHWSESINVKCSFWFLIKYLLKKKYIGKDFKDINSPNYTRFLVVKNVKKKNFFIFLKNIFSRKKEI